jgi:signal transduction histidine kinase
MATLLSTEDSVCGTPTGGAAVDDRFYRDLLANMRNGVIVIRRDGTLVSMNDAAYASLALTPRSDDEGQPASVVLSKAPELVRVLDQAFDTEVLANRAEVRLASTGRSIGYTLSLVRNQLGDTTGAALFFKDLTRVEFIEERERLRDRLAALGEMAAAIAHEVKNPLAGIEVMAGLLKRRLPGDAASVTLLNDIITEAKMANAIVLEVLEFVRPVRLHVDTVRVATLLGDALLMAGSQVPRGDVVVSVDVADDVPDIHGDDHQLRQVFTNLLTNALEALNGEGRLDLRVSVPRQPVWPGSDVTHAQVVLIEIEDDGPGVPESIRDRIFNPFFTTKPKGSGLGLAIVRKIVDAHEGRLDWQEGAGGVGSCFRIALPVRPALEPVVAAASDEGAPGGPRLR